MNDNLSLILSVVHISEDGIYDSELPKSDQTEELILRQEVSSKLYENYLTEISKNHSIPVMDSEIERFIGKIPWQGIVLDIGGCWGWHWRKIGEKRPDIKIVIVDFVRKNLSHAKQMLGDLVLKQVYLVHADAMFLPFKDESFDGIWTVQTFQHIPQFDSVSQEAYRVLKRGGIFINYSLHVTPMIRLVYWLFRKHYHIKGKVEGMYFFNRASDEQRDALSTIFKSKVEDRYTECLFHPNFFGNFSGSEESIFGRLDSLMSHFPLFAQLLARQRSFSLYKR